MFGTNNQHVPKSEFCTLVNKHCGRQHGHNYDHELVFGQTVHPMLSDHCRVCLSVLSVTFVHCDQTAGRIKMKLDMQAGLGPGHIVLDGDPPRPKRGTTFQFLAHVYCRQMAGDIVLDGDPAPPKRGIYFISIHCHMYLCFLLHYLTGLLLALLGLDLGTSGLGLGVGLERKVLFTFITRAQQQLRWATVWPQ